MKKAIFLTIIIILLCSLCGCGSVYSQRRDISDLIVAETMGIDSLSGGTQLSLASAAADSAPMRISSEGGSISTAIDRAGNSIVGGDLFCAHISSVILGSETAENGFEDYTEYICRSPDIRIDVDIFVLKNAQASAAVLDTGGDSSGISEVLSRIKQGAKNRSLPHIYSAAEICGRSDESGAALIFGLELPESAEKTENSEKTVIPCGYGITDNYRLIDWLPPSLSPVTGILENRSYVCEYPVGGALLELESAAAQFVPHWDENGLSEIQINVRAAASVLETEKGRENLALLTEAFEKALIQDINAVMQKSKDSGCDFLALGRKIELSSPEQYAKLDRPFSELLPQLRFTVSVSGTLSHTNDTRK